MPFPPDCQLEYEPWMHDFTSEVRGNRIHGLGVDTNGSGSYAFAADPGSSSREVMRFVCTTAAARRGHIFNVEIKESGATSATDDFSDIWIEAEMRLDWNSETAASKIHSFIRFFNEAGTVELATISMANGGNCRIDLSDLTNSSSSGNEIPENTWKLFRCRWKASTGSSDGIAEFWLSDLDGSNRSLVHSKTHDIQTNCGRIFVGNVRTGFTGNTATYVANVAIHREATLDRFSLDDEVWCVKDGGLPLWTTMVSQTQASFSLHWHPSVHDAAWTTNDDVTSEIEYVAGDYTDSTFPGSGTTTASGVALPSSDEFCGSFNISSLTAGTLYSARIKTWSPTAGVTRYVGPVFQFRTLPATPSLLTIITEFCQKVEEYMPLSDGDIAAEGNVISFRVFHGDHYYVDQSGASDPPTSWAPVTTKQEWLRDYIRVALLSRFCILANRKSAKFLQDDDHDAGINNWDQGWVKGFVTTQNSSGDDGPDRDNISPDSDHQGLVGGTLTVSFNENGGSPDTITRASGSFITDGFLADMHLNVTGSASNNGNYNIESVAALTLTLRATDDVTAEASVSCTLAGSLTKGMVYDRFQEAYHILLRKAYFGLAYNGSSWHDRAEHRYVETGFTALCFFDTRRFRDDDGTDGKPFSNSAKTLLGKDQADYWVDYFTNTCTKQNVIICSASNFSDLHLSGGDNWQDESEWRAEWFAIEDAIMGNNSIQKVILLSGDRHATVIERRNKTGQWNRTGSPFSKLVGHARVGPKSAGLVPSYDTETITQDVALASDMGAGGVDGRPAKGYGRIVFDEGSGSIQWKAIQDDGTVEGQGQYTLGGGGRMAIVLGD